MSSIYTTYYLNQSGRGEIGNLYRPDFYGIQRGRGLGSILGGLMRILRPLFMRGLQAVKKQAMRTGADIISDIGTKPFKDILINRGREAKKKLSEKAMEKLHSMSGAGDINGGPNIGSFIQATSLNHSTSKKKKKKSSNILKRLASKVSKKKKRKRETEKKSKGEGNRKNKTYTRTLDIFA